MKRKTRVHIQRIIFLAKLVGGTIGFIALLCRYQTLRHLVSLFAVSCVIVALWEYAEWRAANDVVRED